MNKILAIYPGRFQPFCLHHKVMFDNLCLEFGRENTFIVSTNNQDDDKQNPFSFEERQQIVDKYGIKDRYIQVKFAYNAQEILKNYDLSKTIVIYIAGAKDHGRVANMIGRNKKNGEERYLKLCDMTNLETADKHSYLRIEPNIPTMLSGTTARYKLKHSVSEDTFMRIFGWYDENISKLIQEKLG